MLDLAALDDDLDDFPLTEEIPPALGRPTPDEGFFYGVFGETVNLLAQHTEADPVAHIAALYSYIGCMSGRQYSVFGQPPTCNPLLIGDSGLGRKGTAWTDVRRLFSRIRDASLLPRVTGSCASEAGLVREVRDKSEKSKDGVPVDVGVEDKRLWVNVSEFGEVFQSMKNPIFKLQECLCRIYDGDDLRISTSKGIMAATGQAITVYGNITGEMLAQRFDPHALSSGILTRLMPVLVDRVRYYRGLEIPEDFKRECAAKGLDIADRINRMRGKVGKGETQEIVFHRDVHRWWRRELHEYLTTPPAHLSGFTRMWSSRRASNFQRIATIIALAHETDEVTMEHAIPALKFVDYSMNSLEYAASEFRIAPVTMSRTAAVSPRARKWHAHMLQAHHAGRDFVTRKEINVEVFKGNVKSEQLDELEREVPDLTFFMDKFDGNPTATKCYFLRDHESAAS